MDSIKTRRKVLLEIIEKDSVQSQEDLAERLRQRGINATQATLSRDLRAMGITKVPGYGYTSSKPIQPNESGLSESINSIEFSGQIAVLKSNLGMAPAIAAMLDKYSFRPIIGTIAGDDTVLLLLRQGFTPTQVLDSLDAVLPSIKGRYIQ